MDAELTIQEAAAETGLSIHTLRYYERIGLIHPVDRATNGHRRYTPGDLGWIDLLKRLRATGMPIQRMQQYAALQRQGEFIRAGAAASVGSAPRQRAGADRGPGRKSGGHRI